MLICLRPLEAPSSRRSSSWRKKEKSSLKTIAARPAWIYFCKECCTWRSERSTSTHLSTTRPSLATAQRSRFPTKLSNCSKKSPPCWSSQMRSASYWTLERRSCLQALSAGTPATRSFCDSSQLQDTQKLQFKVYKTKAPKRVELLRQRNKKNIVVWVKTRYFLDPARILSTPSSKWFPLLKGHLQLYLISHLSSASALKAANLARTFLDSAPVQTRSPTKITTESRTTISSLRSRN